MFSRRTIILDCGSRHTALGVFADRSGRLALEHCAMEEFTDASLEAGQWLERTITAMRLLRRGLRSAGPAVVVLPAHLTLAKSIKVPRIDSARRAGIIRFEAGQYVPTALSEVAWDSVVTGAVGVDDDILIAAVKLDLVEPLCHAAQAAGLPPRMVLPAALATVAGFRLGIHPPHGTRLVLHLGVRAAMLFLIRPDGFQLRPMPLNCGASEAKLGDEAGFGRLELELKRALDLLQKDSECELPASVHLAGMAPRLPGLDVMLTTQLGLAVEQWDVGEAFAPADMLAAPARSVGALNELAGAAATQLLPHPTILNLLPVPRRRREELRRRLPFLVAAGSLAVAALFPPWFYYHSVAAAAQARSTAMERTLVPLRARNVRLHHQLLALERCKRELAVLEGVAARRSGWLPAGRFASEAASRGRRLAGAPAGHTG